MTEKRRSSNPSRFPTVKPGFIWDKPGRMLDIIQDQVSVNIRLVIAPPKADLFAIKVIYLVIY